MKSRKNNKNIIIALIIIILAIIAGFAFYTGNLLGKIQKKDIPKDNESLGISEAEVDKGQGITNIALFGFDFSNERTDSIMVVSIDKDKNVVKVTSLLRDMYLDLPGYGKEILNHAYMKGGPALAIKTINTSFGLDIKDYVTIKMEGVIKLVDAVGGVDIDIKEDEIPYINEKVALFAEKTNYGSVNKIVKPGMQTLNGAQALAYSGVRKVGTDFGRTLRQRNVLNQVFKKIKAGGVLKLSQDIETFLPYVETSLDNNILVSLSKVMIRSKGETLEEFAVPIDGTYKQQHISGMDVLIIDLEANKSKLHEFIYGNVGK